MNVGATQHYRHPRIEEPPELQQHHEDYLPPPVYTVPNYRAPQQQYQQPAFDNQRQEHPGYNANYERRPPPPVGHREIKVKIPTFHGTYDTGVFLDWVNKCESALRHCHYEKYEKMDLATLHFEDAVLSWWHRLVTYREMRRLPPIESWN